jgi:polyhydroxybutyrate depolymerase
VAGDRGLVRSTDETIAAWVEINHCAADATEMVIDALPDDGTRAVISTYADCDAETFVTLYRVEGGGHTWPGADSSLPARLVGETTQEFSASEVIYGLFGGEPEE